MHAQNDSIHRVVVAVPDRSPRGHETRRLRAMRERPRGGLGPLVPVDQRPRRADRAIDRHPERYP